MTEPTDDQPWTIDEIVAALTSPARAEELEGEADLVSAMAAAVVAEHPKEPAPMPSRSRPLKIAVLAGAAVLSLAGVAAAATGALPSRPTQVPAVTASGNDPTSTTTTMATTTTSVGTTSSSNDSTTTSSSNDSTMSSTDNTTGTTAAASPSVTAPPCPADVTSHGAYVSNVARTTPPGPDHGKVVAAAAQSDCGKPNGASGSTTASTTNQHGQNGHGPNNQGGQGDHGNGKQGGQGNPAAQSNRGGKGKGTGGGG